VDRENERTSTGHTENTPNVESSTNAAGNSSLAAPGPAVSQQTTPTPDGTLPRLKARSATASAATASSVQPGPDSPAAPSNSAGDVFEEASIGASFHGKTTIRHDGVKVYGVQQGGVAEDIGIKAGDFIVAIDDHYLFIIQELDTELRSHPYGSGVDIRYQRNALIYDNLITLGPRHP
jgi:C-terminal processing protease CtpA/Prc